MVNLPGSRTSLRSFTEQLNNLDNTESKSSWRARALIDLAALRNNIDQVRKISHGVKLMAVIKADAYGHGLKTICSATHEIVDAFAVATISEGIECRRIQNSKPIVVLSELWKQSQLDQFEENNLQVVVHNREQIKWLQEYRGNPLAVWVKIDTGMSRLGINPHEVDAIYKILNSLPGISEIRLMSHLANADDVEDDFTDHQIQTFKKVTNKYDCEKSLANSAGALGWSESHYSWIRPGLLLYGASPLLKNRPNKLNLQPVMQLQSRIIAIKNIGINQPVGYGGKFRTSKASKIAMIGIGYGDGYPRLVNANACVLIREQRAPIVGRVSMDMITVDITDITNVKVGDEVTLWGHNLRVEEVAEWAGTIPYELLCKVTTRIPRIPANTKP